MKKARTMAKIRIAQDVYLCTENRLRYIRTVDSQGNIHKWRLKAGEDGGLEILLASNSASSITILPYVANQIELRPRF
jgi:hypothetical protein